MKKTREQLVREANAILRNAGAGKLAIRARTMDTSKARPMPRDRGEVGAPPSCPRCAGQMVARTRTSDGHTFFGCRDYPRCTGTVDGRFYDPSEDDFDSDF